ncbi:hypothetical protein L6Q96_13815 [Candidatus Binatia bacterium]|nr:hypothetical protein [Candidatus Binatia bacterium]
MADEHEDNRPLDAQEALRLIDDACSRLRTAIWALHGMHQDMSALSAEDLADVEQLLTEILETSLTPGFEAVSQVLGSAAGGTVTTH